MKGKKEKVDEKQEKGKPAKGKEKEKATLTVDQLDDAPNAITLIVDGQSLVGDKKEFSSSSVGWNVNGKVVIGGLKCQVSANIIIVGSKNVKK